MAHNGATQWVQVKYRWRLSINSTERSRLSSILSGSCGSRATLVPGRADSGSAAVSAVIDDPSG